MSETEESRGRLLSSSVLVFALCCGPSSLVALGDIRILPTEVFLDGPKSTQRLLVQRIVDDEDGGPAQNLVLQSKDSKVAVVIDGLVIPKSNGQTTIVTKDESGATAAVNVTVSEMDTPHLWGFRHEVLPALTKSGCNSGACHGALAGKGGFKLSLRGYDPLGDFHSITRQADGRRVELADPGRSLVLAKPSGAIPHKGGLRFAVDSHEYEILSQWIAQGAETPQAEDAVLERIEVLPRQTLSSSGGQQQFLVQAHYDDGKVRDVTRWAKFASVDETVLKVDDRGTASVVGYGEGAITAWFSSKIVVGRVTVPYDHDVDERYFDEQPPANFVDQFVLKKLRRLNLVPSPRATDDEFVRRVYLDCIGTLPSSCEVIAFLEDLTLNKREVLIDRLLARPEFVDYWTYKWSDLLLLNGNNLSAPVIKAFYQWLREHVAASTPWDVLVRQIVTARGTSTDNGATNFYALHQDPEDMTENICQAFMGLSIACAKCHNHPLEKWTNDQYYGMASFFARVRSKVWQGQNNKEKSFRTVFVANSGELIQPLRGRPQPARPLDGEAIPNDTIRDRREYLAKWLTSSDNPYFGRSITNRIWSNFFGVGLVEEVDDMRVSNPASNEELLNAAADYLVSRRYDLKSLMRVIMQSQTYQRSSQPLPSNAQETRFYSRYYSRRLMAEVLLDAVSNVTGVPSEFNETITPSGELKRTEFYPPGTRAIQLFDSAVRSYFLKTFGRNGREITCECERSDEPTMVQVLHISNGNTINGKLQSPNSRIDELMQSSSTSNDLIDQTYLLTLARLPTATERSRFRRILEETTQKQRREAVEDLFWAVMSSREFLFNH